MKRAIRVMSVMIAFVMLISVWAVMPASAKGNNLLPSGDFDAFYNGGVITPQPGWRVDVGPSADKTYTWEDAIVQNPQTLTGGCLKLAGPYTRFYSVSVTLTGLDIDTTYEISFDAYSNTASGTFVSVNNNADGLGNTYIGSGTAFSHYTIRRKPSELGSLYISFISHVSLSNDSTVTYFDNVSVCSLTEYEMRNLIPNGGFETIAPGASLPVGFSAYHANYTTPILSTEEAYDGTHSIKFEYTSPLTAGMLENIALQPGYYRLSFHVKGGRLDCSMGTVIASWAYPTTYAYGGIETIGWTETTTWEDVAETPWVEYSFVLNVTSAGSYAPAFILQRNSNSLPAYLDGVSLVKLDSPYVGFYNKYIRYNTANFYVYENINDFADTNVPPEKKLTSTVKQAVRAYSVSTKENESAILLVAQYKNEGEAQRMVAVDTVQATAASAGELMTFEKDITLNAEAESITVFLWENGSLTPYIKALSLK